MSIKTSISKFFWKKPLKDTGEIINVYKTNFGKHALISYITYPFFDINRFSHQNYLTSHLVAESFSELGFDVDVVDYLKDDLSIDYDKYAVIFGFGPNFERSFYNSNRRIPRIHFITGAHRYLHNEMSLRSIQDFYILSGIWLPSEANILTEDAFFSLHNADFAIIIARGDILADYKSRFENPVYPLNNNILGAFLNLKPKSIADRKPNFLFLSGGRQLTKGLPILLEFARLRPELNFYILVPLVSEVLEHYYKDLLDSSNVFLRKGLTMDSPEMHHVIELCSYTIAPSYIDGLPGGTIEPMSAGLIPIVSKYCGFPKEDFIYEMDELSKEGLNRTVDRVLALDDLEYLGYSRAARAYAIDKFSSLVTKKGLKEILFNALN